MSLKGLKLSSETVARLYTLPLFAEDHHPATKDEPPPDPARHTPKYMGDNAGNITVLVNHSDAPYLSNELFEFFTGVLNACKLSMKDVALFNLHRTPESYQTLQAETQPAKMLLLGVIPDEIGLPMQFPHFQIYKHNNISYLSAPDLAVIQGDKSLKSALWKALQALFEL